MITRLRIDGIRNLRSIDLNADRINWLIGENGAGKTSVLEAIHLTAVGRSFRGGNRPDWLHRENKACSVLLDLSNGRRLAWVQDSGGWKGRVNGENVATRSSLVEYLTCLVFHPQSHEIVQGPPEERRRLLDYAVFHVEHSFLKAWRAYRRAMSQRNAALRSRSDVAGLRAWEKEMALHASTIDRLRRDLVARLSENLAASAGDWVEDTAKDFHMDYRRGWSEDLDLDAALEEERPMALESGFTRVGPHRADLRLRDDTALIAPRLSRGQQKVVALRLLVAVGEVVAASSTNVPVFCIDDFTAELDRSNQERVRCWAQQVPWQLWISSLDRSAATPFEDARVFHVEHGRISS